MYNSENYDFSSKQKKKKVILDSFFQDHAALDDEVIVILHPSIHQSDWDCTVSNHCSTMKRDIVNVKN